MAELIEKVARLAGWVYDAKCDDWILNDEDTCMLISGPAGDPTTYLSADGLRILLDELLRAGFAIIGTYEVHQVSPFGDEVEPIEARADTLEEAVMLAYIAMKEGNNG